MRATSDARTRASARPGTGLWFVMPREGARRLAAPRRLCGMVPGCPQVRNRSGQHCQADSKIAGASLADS
jgi:hypothetical protein